VSKLLDVLASFAQIRQASSPESYHSTLLIGLLSHSGTLTKNELTVTELYTFDELKQLQVGMSHHGRISDALRRNIAIGNLCNNAFRNGEGVNVGQSTDVALLDVVTTFGLQDQRTVCFATLVKELY
jgi:magnesium-transporting ATPase (P-type)